jgi:putative hydrolase of the HAD superfamily
MTRPPIRFLFFDLGRVLLHFDHEAGVRQLAELGAVGPDLVRQVVFESSLQADYEKGWISTAEFCQRLREATGMQAADEDICHAASNIFWKNRPVIDVVHRLRQAHWPVGLLSNTCDAHWRFICQNHRELADCFKPRILSFEVGSAKPETGIFRAAAAQVQREPNEIFFVDDLPANVEGARRAGLDAVLYTSPKQLRADLRRRDVLPEE